MIELVRHSRPALALAFSPDGMTLASGGGDGLLCAWDTAAGELVASHPLDYPFVFDLAYHPGGEWLALADGRRDLRTVGAAALVSRSPLVIASQPVGWSVRSVAFATGRNSIVVIGHESTYTTNYHIWKISEEGLPVITGSPWRFDTRTPRNENVSLSLAPDGRSMAYSHTGGGIAVNYWKTSESGVRYHEPEVPGGRTVSTVAYSPDGETLGAVTGKVVTIWDVKWVNHESRDYEYLQTTLRLLLEGHDRAVRSFAFSPDGRVAATASLDGTLRFWNPYDGSEAGRIDPGVGRLHRVAFSPDGNKVAVAGHGGKIFLFDVDVSL